MERNMTDTQVQRLTLNQEEVGEKNIDVGDVEKQKRKKGGW